MFERDTAPHQFAVIGLGRFGIMVARALTERGHEVLGIDRSEEAVQAAKEVVTHAIQAEITDEALLRELGLDEMDVAVVAIGDDVEASIFVTALLVEAGVPQVAARANTHLHGLILQRIGATRVVYPEAESGAVLAQQLRAPGITDYFALGADIGVARLDAPRAWIGHTLAELRRKHTQFSMILAIQRGDETIAQPGPEESIQERDILVLLCQDSKLDELPSAYMPRRQGRR